jgi:signal recognition particle GTPase
MPAAGRSGPGAGVRKKLKSGKGFDLNDFKEQIAQMKQDGRPVA